MDDNNFIRLVDLEKIDSKKYSFYGIESIVLTFNRKILLQQRDEDWNRFGGYLTAFGGGIEKDELPIEALIRELKEELGARVEKKDVVMLGAITEKVTKYSELIYCYFWHDRYKTITGCYEGNPRYYDTVQDVFHHPKIMDALRWELKECKKRGLLK